MTIADRGRRWMDSWQSRTGPSSVAKRTEAMDNSQGRRNASTGASEHADPVTLTRVVEVLRLRPAGLFTDIDGTISAIAATPSQAVVIERAREALKRLARRLDIVGAVTGRAADDGARLVGVPELVV